MTPLIRKSVPADVEFLAPRLRAADVAELKASGAGCAAFALKQGLKISEVCYTGLDPETGEPAVMFGVVRTIARKGYNTLWLLGTDAVERHGRLFARRSKRLLPLILGRYHRVGNYVDTRNTFSLNWLLWLGFRVAHTTRTNTAAFVLFLKGRGE